MQHTSLAGLVVSSVHARCTEIDRNNRSIRIVGRHRGPERSAIVRRCYMELCDWTRGIEDIDTTRPMNLLTRIAHTKSRVSRHIFFLLKYKPEAIVADQPMSKTRVRVLWTENVPSQVLFLFFPSRTEAAVHKCQRNLVLGRAPVTARPA